MNPRVLMVYDKFPPFNVSGTARAFHFAKQLPELGWDVTVLTKTPETHEIADSNPLAELPHRVSVLSAAPWLDPGKDRVAAWLNSRRRTRAAESALRASASAAPPERRMRQVFQPNSWAWRASGLPMWLIEWHLDWAPAAISRALSDPHARASDVVWVSAPEMRNVVVGDALSRLLGKPLVVDLRDPWTYGSLWQPRGRLAERAERAQARRVLSRARRVVVTSPLTQREMELRFPKAHFTTITNGFSRDPSLRSLRGVAEGRCLFRYVGVLNERRTPDALIEGFGLACQDAQFRARVHLEFVGASNRYHALLERHGVSDVVSFRGRVPLRESLELMRGSDINLLLQTIAEGQDVIAGKTFEYLAAGKPILAAISEHGGDAWLLARVGGAVLAPYSDPARIAAAFRHALSDFERGRGGADPTKLAAFERTRLAEQLAAVLGEARGMSRHSSSA